MFYTGRFYIVLGGQGDLSSLEKDGARVVSLLYGKFGVDEARLLRQNIESITTFEKVYFVLQVATCTPEAQNALLKITEELPAHIGCIVVVPVSIVLLDTLVSRATIIEQSDTDTVLDYVDTFLGATYAKRLDIVGVLCDAKKYEDYAFMRKEILLFLDKTKNRIGTAITPEIAKLYIDTLSYIKNDSVSLKSVLEHFALVLPYDIL